MSEHVNPAGDIGRTPLDPELQQFYDAENDIRFAIAAAPAYFTQVRYGALDTDPNKGQDAISEFEAVLNEFAAQSLADQRVVTLYYGNASNHPAFPRELAGRQAVEALYDRFSRRTVAGAREVSYETIQDDAVNAHTEQLGAIARNPLDGVSPSLRQVAVVANHRTVVTLPVGSRAALMNYNGELNGVQLRVSRNIHVNFLLGNFDKQSEATGNSMSYVELIVTPDSALTVN